MSGAGWMSGVHVCVRVCFSLLLLLTEGVYGYEYYRTCFSVTTNRMSDPCGHPVAWTCH